MAAPRAFSTGAGSPLCTSLSRAAPAFSSAPAGQSHSIAKDVQNGGRRGWASSGLHPRQSRRASSRRRRRGLQRQLGRGLHWQVPPLAGRSPPATSSCLTTSMCDMQRLVCHAVRQSQFGRWLQPRGRQQRPAKLPCSSPASQVGSEASAFEAPTRQLQRPPLPRGLLLPPLRACCSQAQRTSGRMTGLLAPT